MPVSWAQNQMIELGDDKLLGALERVIGRTRGRDLCHLDAGRDVDKELPEKGEQSQSPAEHRSVRHCKKQTNVMAFANLSSKGMLLEGRT